MTLEEAIEEIHLCVGGYIETCMETASEEDVAYVEDAWRIMLAAATKDSEDA